MCRCMKMALVHDIAESIAGDITPFCNVTKEEKHKLEMDAMQVQGRGGSEGGRLSVCVVGAGVPHLTHSPPPDPYS